jgi:hypothetical protein
MLILTTLAWATVSGNTIVSEQSPELTLRVDDSFAALAPLRFPIEDLTDAERRIFVDADAQGAVERLVIVQFERVQPGSDFRFVYPSTPPRRFGAQVYRFGTFIYDDARAAVQSPSREAGRTRSFLKKSGYTPPRFYRVARLARVTDDDGLTEVIIFYMEAADRDIPGGPSDEDGDWPVSGAEQEALAARMEAVIDVLEG